MSNVRVVLVAMAWSSAGCSILYDSGDLRGEGAAGPQGGGGATASTAQGPSTTNAGGGGGAACACEPVEGLVWLLQSPGAALGAPAPGCPVGASALADGALANSLVDGSSQCGGPCTGTSAVKVAIDDSCGVSGDGVPNDGSCDPKAIVPDNGGDTSLSINLEPTPCMLPSPALVDNATITRVSVCETVGDPCNVPASARACIPGRSGVCDDPCFGEQTTVSVIEDTRTCAGVFATCSPPVIGTLELHDDAACATPSVAAWNIANAAICPASPSAPAAPTTSYWKYTPTPQSCDAFGTPNGTVMTGQTVMDLCCAPASS